VIDQWQNFLLPATYYGVEARVCRHSTRTFLLGTTAVIHLPSFLPLLSVLTKSSLLFSLSPVDRCPDFMHCDEYSPCSQLRVWPQWVFPFVSRFFVPLRKGSSQEWNTICMLHCSFKNVYTRLRSFYCLSRALATVWTRYRQTAPCRLNTGKQTHPGGSTGQIRIRYGKWRIVFIYSVFRVHIVFVMFRIHIFAPE
jgi:hypothetical protein